MATILKKGDILLPKTKIGRKDWLDGLFHAAVIWQDIFDGSGDFIGLVLTSSGPKNGYSENVLMQANHFIQDYSFTFKNTHFINQKFVKLMSWGPFKKVGQLTEEGLYFIEQNIVNNHPIEFSEFLTLQKSAK